MVGKCKAHLRHIEITIQLISEPTPETHKTKKVSFGDLSDFFN